MAETDQNASANPANVDYDRHEPKSGLIAAISLTVIGVLSVLIIGVYWFYMVSYDNVEFEQNTGVSSQELKALRDREDQQLHQYSYIDKGKGVVRIPIDKAMEILAAEARDGKTSYNTTTYAVKVEPLGGAAGGTGTAAAPPPAPAAALAPAATKH